MKKNIKTREVQEQSLKRGYDTKNFGSFETELVCGLLVFRQIRQILFRNYLVCQQIKSNIWKRIIIRDQAQILFSPLYRRRQFSPHFVKAFVGIFDGNI